MKARLWFEHLASNEWGNELMRQIAVARFEADPSIDVCEVHEHGGWWLTFTRSMIVAGTANDMAQLSRDAHEWARQFDGEEIVGECRRQADGQHRESVYPVRDFPRLAACA